MALRSEAVSWTGFKINELRTILETEMQEDCGLLKTKKDYVNACRQLDRNVSQKWFRKLRDSSVHTEDTSASRANSNTNSADRPPPPPRTNSNTNADRPPPPPRANTNTNTNADRPPTRTNTDNPPRSHTRSATARAPVSAPLKLAPPASKVNHRASLDASRLARQQLPRIAAKAIPPSLFTTSSSSQSPVEESEEDVFAARDRVWESLRRPTSPQTRSKDFDRVEQQLHKSLRLLSSGEIPPNSAAAAEAAESELENVLPSQRIDKTPAVGGSRHAPPRSRVRRVESARPAWHGGASRNTTPISTPITTTPVLTPLKEFVDRAGAEDEPASSPTPLLQPRNRTQAPSPPQTLPVDKYPRRKWMYVYCRPISAVVALLAGLVAYLAVPAPEQPFGHSRLQLCATSIKASSGCIPMCPTHALCDDGVVRCGALRQLVALNPFEWRCKVDDAALAKVLNPIVVRLKEDFRNSKCSSNFGLDMYELLNQVDPGLDPLVFSSALTERSADITQEFGLERSGFNLRMPNLNANECRESQFALGCLWVLLFVVCALLGFIFARQLAKLNKAKARTVAFIRSKTQIVTPEMYVMGPTFDEVSAHLKQDRELAPGYCTVPSIAYLVRSDRDIVLCGLRQSTKDFLFSRSKAAQLLADVDPLRFATTLTTTATPKLKPPLIKLT